MANTRSTADAETPGLRPHFGSPLVSRDRKLQSQRGLVGLRLYMCPNTTRYIVHTKFQTCDLNSEGTVCQSGPSKCTRSVYVLWSHHGSLGYHDFDVQ